MFTITPTKISKPTAVSALNTERHIKYKATMPMSDSGIVKMMIKGSENDSN